MERSIAKSEKQIDFSQLKKGDYVTPESIREVIGLDPKTTEYSMKMMGLVEQARRELQHLEATIVIHKYGISILTDEQATVYNERRFDTGIGVMERAHSQAAKVDTTNFDSELKMVHARRLTVQGAIIGAVTKTRKELKLTAHERTTPGVENKE